MSHLPSISGGTGTAGAVGSGTDVGTAPQLPAGLLVEDGRTHLGKAQGLPAEYEVAPECGLQLGRRGAEDSGSVRPVFVALSHIFPIFARNAKSLSLSIRPM
jgi:hypothetical protein